jgi:oxygen-dependent protoporphyrinogen oxidase
MKVAVVGAGITGLTAAFRLREGARRAGRPLELTVLEAAERPGGHARTLREDGFLVEAGPNGFLDRDGQPEPIELIRSLGIESRLIEARPAARRRFVFHRGRLRRVPDSPPALASSNALSLRGKLRVLLEPWARSAPDVEETVASFARRRFGGEAADVLVDAAISGISAGDSRRLSMAASFPMLVEMERKHGSLIRALMAAPRRRAPRLLSFQGGMETLIVALCGQLGGSLRTGCAVRGIVRAGGEWRLLLEGGGVLAADRVLLAVPAPSAAALLGALDPELSQTLSALPFAGLAVVALAFREPAVGRLDGYGYLVPGSEQLDTLGVLWESSVFEARAERGTVLMRAMLGGARRPEVAVLPEAELVRRARRELAQVLGVSTPPIRTWVWRWPQAIAQYHVGHAARVQAARERARAHPGLELAGTSYDGISFTAAMKSATEAAERILGALGGEPSSVPPGAGGSRVESEASLR